MDEIEPASQSTWASDVLTSDGSIIRLRPLGSEDQERYIAFYRELSQEAVHRRFFNYHLPDDDTLCRPLFADPATTFNLGAEADGRLIGVSMYSWDDAHQSAEVAFAVADDHHHRGIGTLLLEHMAAYATEHGITAFHAHTLPYNLAMLGVFEGAGFRLVRESDRDEVFVSFVLDGAADESIAMRDQQSTAASVSRVLRPQSVAVIGASARPNTVGNAVFRNIVMGEFTGTVYPVNPRAVSVLSVRAYPTVADLPECPDVAVLAVPSAVVEQVVVQCAERGVAGLVIITAGFAESGVDGAAAESRIRDIARAHDMRIVGPNCIGIVNSDPAVQLNATFSPAAPVRGGVGFASQSGALGIAALDQAAQVGLGISSFVSLGNKADLSGNDLLQYWESDPETRVAALYLESFGNPQKFSRIAQHFCRSKPLVAVKSGRSSAGRRAASSHTAAMASDDDIADVLFREAGIIRVATLRELFDVCRLLTDQPVPAGPRVAIVGNSGGPGILAADACEAAGLEVPALSADTQAALTALLPAGAGVSNPVDLIASAGPEQYEQALSLVLADECVDALIVIYTDPLVSSPDAIASAIGRAAVGADPTKPIAANLFAADVGHTIGGPDDGHAPIPVYDFPESVAVALGHAAGLAAWRARPRALPAPVSGVDRATAGQIVSADPLGPADRWLDPSELSTLLESWGIDVLRTRQVRSASEAAQVAADFGVPVALKVESDTILHKTDVGGVVLGLDSPAQVGAAYEAMMAELGSEMAGAIVQPMVGDGIELIVGGLADPQFGPTVLFGAGGTAAEVWKDRVLGLTPLSDAQTWELINAPKVAALLRGHRGAPPVDLDALHDLVSRVASLLDAFPRIIELDLNPVIATPGGVHVVDSRCRIGPVITSVHRSGRRLS